jgi:hypothetical protein
MKRFVTTSAFLLGTLLSSIANSASAAPAPKPAATSPSKSMEGETKRVKVKYKDKTNVDFSDALIEGAAKNPFMSMVGSRDQEFGKGFVKIRYNWHDQLIMSTSGLTQ